MAAWTTYLRRMAPANHQLDITKSDVTEYDPPLAAIHVGGAGTVRTVSSGGDTANYTVPAGGYIFGQFTKVMSTGTSATLMVGLYNE